jgi:hypothetical protein
MKLDRRELLAGSSAVAFATMAKGAIVSFPSGMPPVVPSGWNTLPLGCGGLVTGFNIAPDGTMVCRTDVGNCYRWSGTTGNVTDPSRRWVPLLTYASMGSGAGGYELVIAPNNTNILYGIFADNAGSQTAYYLYRSTNAGGLWAKTNLSMLNAGSNSTWKNASGKVAVDPNNSSVVYCGMPTSSGNSYSVYQAIDGATFNPISSIAATTVAPGVCGIVFDTSQGTVAVSGQTRTARIIIPVGGVGIYESTDGGQTFNEVFTGTLGNAKFAVFQGYLDFDGTYYCQMNYGAYPAYIWRYSKVTGSWAWVQLDAQAGWPLSAGWLGNNGVLIVDPRSGHQGSVSTTGPNGFGAGYTSSNANSATPSNITWSGRTGGETPVQTAPNYDVSWLNHATQGRNAFLQSTAVIIDQSGTCWWSGAQGFWYATAIPNYGTNRSITSVAVARGMEVTVAQDVCCPPGATYPVMASQDVGIMRGTFTTFPTDYYVSGGRMDCESLDYAASDPSFMVAKVDAEATAASTGAKSAYSNNYGASGSWTPYVNQPDLMYQGSVIGYIDKGSGGSGTILHVTAVANGNVMPGQSVSSGSRQLGTITAYGTGTGGVGTYIIGGGQLTTFGFLSLSFATESGTIVAVDHNHHVCVPSGYNGSFVPVYTTNATSRSCSWNFCAGLPQGKWMNRSYIYGPTSKPFAVGYGSDLGTVWAALIVPGTGTTQIYKSTDSGATWSLIATVNMGSSAVTPIGVYLCSVPNYPGQLWLTGQFSGGYNTALSHSTDGGATWTTVPNPSGQELAYAFTLGAPATPGGYPALFGVFYATYGAKQYLYHGTYSGGAVTWSRFGPTGTQNDMPISCQVAGFQSIHGDWNVYQRLYVCSGQSGFAYYSP